MRSLRAGILAEPGEQLGPEALRACTFIGNQIIDVARRSREQLVEYAEAGDCDNVILVSEKGQLKAFVELLPHRENKLCFHQMWP